LGIAPEIINDDALQKGFKNGIVNYPGLKEDVYVASYQPDPRFLEKMNLTRTDTIVTIRPPATEAHYHNPEAETLFAEVIAHLGESPGVKMVILPRNEVAQKQLILERWSEWCKTGKIIIPDQVVNGLDMVWHSDLVVSGGGTMNREAAALDVPVFSIFRGKMGAVDKYLSEQGRLTFIETTADVRAKIKPVKRKRKEFDQTHTRPALDRIIAAIEDVIAGQS
jgi:predicted glycosyltransferase